MKQSKTKIHVTTLFLIAIFPVIFGTVLYHFRDHFHFKTLNHGTLINPPIAVEDLKIQDANKHQWQLIYFPAACLDDKTQKTMFTYHQLRQILGKDSQRIDLAIVVSATCAASDTHDYRRINYSDAQYQKLAQQIGGAGAHFELREKVYLLDPMGNLFMYYPTTENPIHIMNDLKRVFEVSQIG